MIRNVIFDWSGTLVDDLPPECFFSIATKLGTESMSFLFRLLLLFLVDFSKVSTTAETLLRRLALCFLGSSKIFLSVLS